MTKTFEVFFSNQLEVLYQYLRSSLFDPTLHPFSRRLVVVYGPAMKTWLQLKMANDPVLNVSMGIEFVYLNQAFDCLLKFSSNKTFYLPTPIEIALAIEIELREILKNYHHLTTEEQHDWKPLIDYFKLSPKQLHQSIPRKIEKRIVSLSQYLAHLFHDYGRFACQMVSKWDSSIYDGWQSRLWNKLFGKKFSWNYPIRAFKQANITNQDVLSLHFFSITFITSSEFEFLNRLSEHLAVHYYLLSPCAVFWSDIRSDRESTYIQNHWKKKLGSSSSQINQLEELLRDRNPLLANFGRLGREMAHLIEQSNVQTYAHYILPQHVQLLNEEIFTNDDLHFIETKGPLTLLHALQADILMMRNPQDLPPKDLEEEQGTIQLHIAPNVRREVEILYHNILNLMHKDPTLLPNDVIVMAPHIEEYIPYIHWIFGMKNSQLNFQILDSGLEKQSEITQAFLLLLEISEGKWDVTQFLKLLTHPAFQRRHHISMSDYHTIQEWMEQVGILWGEDSEHRNEILKRRHCQQGMVDGTEVGTWDHGIYRLLLGLVMHSHPDSLSLYATLPCSLVDFSQSELFAKWISLFYSLRDDLSPLQEGIKMTMHDWINYLICLLEIYFQPNHENSQSAEEYEDLKKILEILQKSAHFFTDVQFPFSSIKLNLKSLLQRSEMTYQENQLHTIRFCSLIPLRTIPAKIIAILGLQEGAFPRSAYHSSMNLMRKQDNRDYCPQAVDYDRYLFLEAVQSTQEYLLLSYQGYGQTDNKELRPSLIVEELFSYLEKFYTVQQKKISEIFIIKHPLDPFDKQYFLDKKFTHSFSQEDFRIAQFLNQSNLIAPYSFLNDFKPHFHDFTLSIEKNHPIDVKNLSAAVRNPIKFHLNKALEIYLQNAKEKKGEENFILSALDKFKLKQFAFNESLEVVLHRAEQEGKLPLGLFKTVAMKQLKNDFEDFQLFLNKMEIDASQILHIEFSNSCIQPIQTAENRWLLPAISLKYNDESELLITGHVPMVTPKGLLVQGKGTFSEVWKVWPQFLLICSAVKFLPHIEPQILFHQSSKVKRAFFDDPLPHLKKLVYYYALCIDHLCPLLPDWIPFILTDNHQGLKNKMDLLFSHSFDGYQNQELRWMLNKQILPNPEHVVSDWKLHAQNLTEEIFEHWYQTTQSDESL